MKHGLLLIVLLMNSSKVLACICIRGGETLEERVMHHYDSTSDVVLAKAEKVANMGRVFFDSRRKEKYKYTQRIQFTALKSWKGQHGNRFYTQVSFCGFKFKQGESYLLYLDGPYEDGYYHAHMFSGTKKETDVIKPELEILNKMGLRDLTRAIALKKLDTDPLI